jgi:hypothetical protein
MDRNDIELHLNQIMPASLDDIIRLNRHMAKLYLTNPAEIDALRASLPIQAAKATISHWALITMFFTKSGEAMVYLTGFNEERGCSWMTSRVTAFDGDALLTKSGSLYRLKGDSTDSPDLPQICASLNSWGVGPTLGVPKFFF